MQNGLVELKYRENKFLKTVCNIHGFRGIIPIFEPKSILKTITPKGISGET
jgi:hypothetical protein